MRKLVAILLAVGLGLSEAAPTTYDQRQEGELNVKVDLDNFVILVARPASDMLDILTDLYGSAHRAVGSKHHHAYVKLQEFHETKSLPREDAAVELDQGAAKPLDDVSMDGEEKKKSSSLEAEARPTESVLVVIETDEDEQKGPRSLRNLKEAGMLEMEQRNKPTTAGKYKFVESVDQNKAQYLKLIGEMVENCGPGRSRDRMGICQGDGLAQE